MNKGPVTLEQVATQLDRTLRELARQEKHLTHMSRQLGELDQKLRHIIHRLPDDYDSVRDPHPLDEEQSDHSHSYLDSEDE